MQNILTGACSEIRVMYRLKTTACILSVMVLPGCSTMTPPNLAPESVAGRVIRLDDRHTQLSERCYGSEQWSDWSDFKYGCVFDFPFDASNQYRLAYNPSESTCMTYRKTGPTTAEIRCESAENAHTCYLSFDTPVSGTATKVGYGEGSDFKQRNIQFQIK